MKNKYIVTFKVESEPQKEHKLEFYKENEDRVKNYMIRFLDYSFAPQLGKKYITEYKIKEYVSKHYFIIAEVYGFSGYKEFFETFYIDEENYIESFKTNLGFFKRKKDVYQVISVSKI